MVVMVGRETQADRRARRRRPRATGLTGSGHWAMAGGRAPSRLDLGNQGTARHGKAWPDRAGQGRAWLATALALGPGHTGLWALEGGRTGNSKTVHRPHANQNRLDPPDGDDPRNQQGRPLLGVYQQLSGPERLKRGIRPMLPVLCARGRAMKFGPASHSDDSRHGPAHSSRHQGRHGTPAGQGTLSSCHSPSLLLNPVPGFLSQSKTPIAHCKLGN